MNKAAYIKDTFCPILNDKCRSDCQWLYENVEITDDGINSDFSCAVNYIVETLLVLDFLDD